jgi:hypothetical protein
VDCGNSCGWTWIKEKLVEFVDQFLPFFLWYCTWSFYHIQVIHWQFFTTMLAWFFFTTAFLWMSTTMWLAMSRNTTVWFYSAMQIYLIYVLANVVKALRVISLVFMLSLSWRRHVTCFYTFYIFMQKNLKWSFFLISYELLYCGIPSCVTWLYKDFCLFFFMIGSMKYDDFFVLII